MIWWRFSHSPPEYRDMSSTWLLSPIELEKRILCIFLLVSSRLVTKGAEKSTHVYSTNNAKWRRNDNMYLLFFIRMNLKKIKYRPFVRMSISPVSFLSWTYIDNRKRKIIFQDVNVTILSNLHSWTEIYILLQD